MGVAGVVVGQASSGMEPGLGATRPEVFSQNMSYEKERVSGSGSGNEPGCEAGAVVPNPEDRAREELNCSHGQFGRTVEIRLTGADPADAVIHLSVRDYDRTETVNPGLCRPNLPGKATVGLGVRSQSGVGPLQHSGGGTNTVISEIGGEQREEVF